jgi:dihydrofolate reductase
MRKVIVQMSISIDGFVAGPDGQLDWQTWEWDTKLKKFVLELTDSCDTILLGRIMTDGFINAWEDILKNQPDSPDFPFAKQMVDYHKVVFSKTLKTVKGKNTIVENGDLVTTVNKLKKQAGKDIITYGGANFVSNLIANNLVDDFYLLVNPTAIGNGLRIFSDKVQLTLSESTAYSCGVVINHFRPTNK